MRRLIFGRIGSVVAFALLFVTLGTRAVRADFPAKAQGYITDAANILDAGSFQDLDARVKAAEQKSSAEIAVVTVSSLDGMSVEEYANRLFKQWGIGKKGRDNGVLVLVAPNERKIRIEVGYGLEPILPDGLSGEIIRNQALPPFKDGDYGKGLVAAVHRIADIVEANETVSPEERQRLANANDPNRPPVLFLTLFLGVFITIGAFLLGVGLRSKTFFFVIFGAGFGGIPFLLGLVIGASTVVLVPLAAGMFIWGLMKGGKDSWRSFSRGQGQLGPSKANTWVMGGSSSSSSSSSYSSSSSSSSSSSDFGGGSSGGGGASGSW